MFHKLYGSQGHYSYIIKYTDSILTVYCPYTVSIRSVHGQRTVCRPNHGKQHLCRYMKMFIKLNIITLKFINGQCSIILFIAFVSIYNIFNNIILPSKCLKLTDTVVANVVIKKPPRNWQLLFNIRPMFELLHTHTQSF